LGEQARATWNDRVAELAKKQQALQNSLTDVADSTGDAWQELAQGMTQARKDMADALQKAEAEFKDKPAHEPKQGAAGEEG
jgi:prefoldin subunit 5